MAVTIDTTIPPATVVLDGMIQKYSTTTDRTLYDKVVSEFVTPVIGNAVTLIVGDTTRYIPTMYIYIQDIGVFKVSSIPSPSSLTLVNVDALASIVVPVGAVITSASKQAITTSGLEFNDTTSAIFNIPSAGNSSTLTLSKGGWVSTGMWLYLSGAGWYKVTSVTNPTTIQVLNPNVDASFNAISATSGTLVAGTRVSLSPPIPYIPDDDTLIINNAGGPGDGRLVTGRTVMQGPQAPAIGDVPYMESGSIPLVYPAPTPSPWWQKVGNTISFANAFKAGTTPIITITLSDGGALPTVDWSPEIFDIIAYNISVVSFMIGIITSVDSSTSYLANVSVNWTAVGVR